jgi:small subunit ribosomal protein S16
VSVAIRLSRAGRVHLPYYHIGVFDSRTRRDGRPVEQLGFYDPESEKEPVRIDLERARHWLSVGARPSATVATILKGLGAKSSEWAPAKGKAAGKAAKKKAEPAKKAAQGGKKAAKPRKPRTANSKARGEKKRQPAG